MIECLTSRNKPVIGMAEPLALPGSYMYDGSGMDVITDRLSGASSAKFRGTAR